MGIRLLLGCGTTGSSLSSARVVSWLAQGAEVAGACSLGVSGLSGFRAAPYKVPDTPGSFVFPLDLKAPRTAPLAVLGVELGEGPHQCTKPGASGLSGPVGTIPCTLRTLLLLLPLKSSKR